MASGWVGARARVAPARASALYLCLYYIGSSVAGSVGGVVWAAVALFAITLLVIALAGVTMSR